MSQLSHIKIPIELFELKVRGLYQMSILALVYNFREQGLHISNGKLAKALFVDKRTIERVISGLKKRGYIKDNGTGKNDRTLVLNTDINGGKVPTLEGASADKTADHNKGKKSNKRNSSKKTGFTPEMEEEFLNTNTREPTEAEADELFREVGIV